MKGNTTDLQNPERREVKKSGFYMLGFFLFYLGLNAGIDFLLGNEITEEKLLPLFVAGASYLFAFLIWFRTTVNGLWIFFGIFLGALFFHQYYRDGYSLYIASFAIPFGGTILFMSLGRGIFRTKTQRSWFERV